MTNPPSHIRVSVEETENGYIVQAGSAVARISRTILGYAVDADSQILKEEYDLSPLVTNTRKSARDLAQLSKDTDDTRLILRASRSFLFLSHAVEMVCGFIPKDFPREDEWKLLSAWKNKVEVVSEPEPVAEPEISNNAPETIPVEPVREEAKKEKDFGNLPYEENGWILNPGVSALLRLDSVVIKNREIIISDAISSFFLEKPLRPGHFSAIHLKYNSKKYNAHIVKEGLPPYNTKLQLDLRLIKQLYLYPPEIQASDCSVIFKVDTGKKVFRMEFGSASSVIEDDGALSSNKIIKTDSNNSTINITNSKEDIEDSPSRSEPESLYYESNVENDLPIQETEENQILKDILQRTNSLEKERTLLKILKHHLRNLGFGNTLVHVLSAFLLYRTCPKSKIIEVSHGGYKPEAFSLDIEHLLAEDVITSFQYRRFIGGNVVYYSVRDINEIISSLIHKKDEIIKELSGYIESILPSLEEKYTVSSYDYLTRNTQDFYDIDLKLINPIISLGLTEDVARILVYLHLFETVPKTDIHQLLQNSASGENAENIIRQLYSTNWITVRDIQRKEGNTYKITQFYSLSQSLSDILLDYVLSHAEGLETSVTEIKLIVDSVTAHPFRSQEVYVSPPDVESGIPEIDYVAPHRDNKQIDDLFRIENSVRNKLIQYGCDSKDTNIIVNLLQKKTVLKSEISSILEKDDSIAREIIEELINTDVLIPSLDTASHETSETPYRLTLSSITFGYRIIEAFENEVKEAESSLDTIAQIERKYIDSSIEGWIKPQYLPGFSELSAMLCSFGMVENVAKTLVLLSVKPISTIQDIVTELNLEESTPNQIKETLLENGFIVEQTVGTSTNYHIAHPISAIISSYIGQIRENYEIEKQEFIDLIKVIADHQENVTRHKRLRHVFFSPFSHPLRSYTKVTEQVYDLKMKKDFPDVRVCLVELLPTEKADLLYASSLEQVDLDSDKEILLYGYYKEYEQYVVWDFSPSYEVLKMRDLTVPTEIFDPVAGQDKILLKTLSSGANIITCPVNKPYQAIKYWYEKKQEKEEEDSWFK